jgi:hypothetical protein
MFEFLSPFKLSTSLSAAGIILALSILDAAPAGALSYVTFVSGKGIDSCASPATPCRTFEFAIKETVANG